MEKRDNRWDNIKLLLIILVVVAHFIGPTIETEDSAWVQTLWTCIYMFHMPAFIFVAGLFAKSTIADKHRMKRKVFSYVRLFVYYEFAIFVIQIILKEEHQAKFRLLRENLYPWYLFVIAAYLLITYAARNVKPMAMLVLAVILGCIAGYDPTMKNFLCFNRVLSFYPFFLLGYYCDRKEIEYILNQKILKLISLAGLIVGFAVTYLAIDKIYLLRPLFTGNGSFYLLPYPMWGGVGRFFYYIVVTAIIFMVFSLVTTKKYWFTAMGQRTLQVYIYHGIIYQIFYHLGFYERWLLDNSLLKQILLLLLSVGIALALTAKPLELPMKTALSNRLFFEEDKN